MSIVLEIFQKAKKQFEQEREKEEGNKVMKKIIELVNEIGSSFSTLNGGELAEIQVKLAGYKFYLADYIAELQRMSEALKIEIKNHKAKRWDEVAEDIKAIKGKVQNKDQIENVIMMETRDMQDQQILYETLYFKYKLKMSALDDILTCIVQQIASKKREVELSKTI